jgi:hypothetical protein
MSGSWKKWAAVIVPNAPRVGPESSGRKFPAVACALLLAPATVCGAGETGTARFPLSDRGPFASLLGIPDGWTDPDGPKAELSWAMASNAMADQDGPELLLLDGETHTLTLRVQRRLGKRLSIGLALPWIAHSGGFLDSAIDSWHDVFGLSEGIRPALPQDDLQFVYARDGIERFRLDHNTSGIGDLHTSAALRLAGGGDGGQPMYLDLTADLDWPTGDPGRLSGNDGVDIAAGLRVGTPAGQGLGWSLGAGILWPGDLDLPLPAPAGQLFYYDASLAWSANQSVELLLQLQGRSGAFQGGLKMLGSSGMQLGAGAMWRVTPRYGLRVGVFEDVRTDTAPDFAAELSLLIRTAD